MLVFVCLMAHVLVPLAECLSGRVLCKSVVVFECNSLDWFCKGQKNRSARPVPVSLCLLCVPFLQIEITS